MNEQAVMAERVNSFLERRGLRANFLARQVGISETMLYCWKRGHRLLSQQQLQRLENFITVYDQKLDGVIERGEHSE